MSENPYPTQPGFGLRVHYAKQALEVYGQCEAAPPYSRAFDNCFEMFDGDAVVWALMHNTMAHKNGNLAEGIRRMDKNVWSQWLEVYKQRGNYAPRRKQLGLFAPSALPRKALKSPSVS